MTLIELLVVMAIVGILATLLAPAGLRQVEKTRALSEWSSLELEVNSLSQSAFFESATISIQFDGSVMRWRSADDSQLVGEKRLNFIFFHPRQSIFINRNGISFPDTVSARLGNANRQLHLNGWLALEEP